MTSTTCQGFKKDGEPCGAPALANSDYCRHHKPEELDEAVLCGHKNVHYKGKKPPELFCDLPQGHEGPHSAVFYATDYKLEGVSFQGEKRTYWEDLAGKPLDQIVPEDLPRTKEEIAYEAALRVLLGE